MIEVILWDNDGVLVDTEELFFAATRDALVRANVELSRDRYVKFALGNGRNMFDLLQARGWTPERIAALRGERDVAYKAMLAAQCRPMDGAVETLRSMQGTARMAVVTTSLREHFEVAHKSSGLREFFELVVAREDYVESKPHPEPYLTALTRLGVQPDRCIAIEDSRRGLTSALAAGLRCIVVPNDLTRGADFSGATAVLDNIRSVPAMLKDFQQR
ncbi:MAG TPA: HAD family phosphatase [Candidatus Binataceae bacterium]|nr:HAD family phosphatase [Candidatus Binataceae bacterium]